ncbi:MAG: 50S ribosomal protein L11 [Candidatus Shikimatogenerans bostrichidophilus]|nr:MAG: 50S ribosomal protein L11 [Candidatus Shikimatogenerans bostrichidophilus]
MKKILKIIKLNIKGGLANPSPPLGPSLGAIGVNIMDFCKNFNNRTKDKINKLLSVNIFVYVDKTFDFKIKKQTVKYKILKLLNINKGSNEPNKKKIGEVTLNDIYKIAKYKMSDLNCFKIKSAVSMIIGTLKSIGVTIKKDDKIN